VSGNLFDVCQSVEELAPGFPEVSVNQYGAGAKPNPASSADSATTVTWVAELTEMVVIPTLVGGVASTVNEGISSWLLMFPAGSVTVTLQLEWVPSDNAVRVIVVLPAMAVVFDEVQSPE